MTGLIASATLCLLAAPVLAQTPSTPRVDQRQELQTQRIEKGAATGQLTKRETKRLQKGQTRVQKMEDKAAADGAVTVKERAVLEIAQDRQSRRIARQKHDRQTAKQ